MKRPQRPHNRALRRAARRRARRDRPAARRASLLAALTSSALSLPGVLGTAHADTPVERWSVDFATSYYAEGEIDDDKVAAGATERYEIQSQQLRLVAPVGDRSDFAVDLLHETMSGATPWFVEPGPGGEPVQVMTGASVEETRTDVLATGSFYFDNLRTSLSGGVSTENDYFAINGGLEAETHFNEKNTSLTGGFGFSLDDLEPTDADLFLTRPSSEKKRSYSAFVSLSQVLGRTSAIQSTLSFQNSSGFLSDPYKLVSVGGVNLADSRPDRRNQIAWLTRYRRHFEGVDATLHADYRLHVDDWGIQAHMLELAWYQTLWERFRLTPSVRYYTQSHAEFYAPYFLAAPADGFYASDYRVSPYGALSTKLRAETVLRDGPFGMAWRLGFLWEHYVSSAGLAPKKVSIENPGLVDFDLFTVNLSARF